VIDPCAPCGPCAAACGPCGPCDPCAPAPAVELTDAEAATVYDCVRDYMRAAYGDAGQFLDWTAYSLVPYVSATHGSRYVMNYANAAAADYRLFEDVDTLPQGAVAAKPSFTVAPDGKASVGPLFLMEKMEAGFDAEAGDWQYGMIMPGGSSAGRDELAFCNQCHAAVGEDQDYLFFLPEEFRLGRR
jgi:hypothetical protein